VVAGPVRGGDDRPSRGGTPWQGPWEDGQGQGRQSGTGAFPTDEEGSTRLVRPYTVTGGRTQPRYKLAIEALVTATVLEPRDLSVLAPECQAILQFCRDWRSVAEISAVLRLPLGVARILVADMGADGLVRIQQRDESEGRPDLNLLERVLSGLRKI
jgi:hypothetical protein